MTEQLSLFLDAELPQSHAEKVPDEAFDLIRRINHLRQFNKRYDVPPRTSPDLDELFHLAYSGHLPKEYKTWSDEMKYSVARRFTAKARSTIEVQQYKIYEQLNKHRRSGKKQELLTGLTKDTFDDPTLCRFVLAISEDRAMPYSYLELPVRTMSRMDALEKLTQDLGEELKQPATIYKARRYNGIIIPSF